ncbi:DNA polymerase ligase N-terminal domain-containing protein [Nocardia miyunensis]|uniref:DNA polymerase ligase N-terminal domain-containing protein n=1 Tax=Nocardia miyunensis TaxID=282684 RepID=UPI000A02FE1D|nr:DNA polymerase ligase N-terminal domain-containing protein [Nocardia miyunensis]
MNMAGTDHYDFRLEIDGVSWVVPEGPSTDPEDKRMAWRTEDHPLEYENFEGVIPERGHLSVVLQGEKLHGGFALTRIRDRKHETWRLVKKSDADAGSPHRPLDDLPESVVSGRALEDLA